MIDTNPDGRPIEAATSPQKIKDEVFAALLFASKAGHLPSGHPPPCTCGDGFLTWMGLIEHLIDHAED